MSVAALIRDMIAEGATPQLILIAVRSLEAVPAQRVKGTVKRKGSKWRAKQDSNHKANRKRKEKSRAGWHGF
mgnify:CR=1 FL=1